LFEDGHGKLRIRGQIDVKIRLFLKNVVDLIEVVLKMYFPLYLHMTGISIVYRDKRLHRLHTRFETKFRLYFIDFVRNVRFGTNALRKQLMGSIPPFLKYVLSFVVSQKIGYMKEKKLLCPVPSLSDLLLLYARQHVLDVDRLVRTVLGVLRTLEIVHDRFEVQKPRIDHRFVVVAKVFQFLVDRFLNFDIHKGIQRLFGQANGTHQPIQERQKPGVSRNKYPHIVTINNANKFSYLSEG
jgi:hypothetical protein